jgi:hypothetical protein
MIDTPLGVRSQSLVSQLAAAGPSQATFKSRSCRTRHASTTFAFGPRLLRSRRIEIKLVGNFLPLWFESSATWFGLYSTH